MPGAFRFFAGGFGGRDEPTADALSMVNFEPGYIGQLIEFGEQDTHERMDELKRFCVVRTLSEPRPAPSCSLRSR